MQHPEEAVDLTSAGKGDIDFQVPGQEPIGDRVPLIPIFTAVQDTLLCVVPYRGHVFVGALCPGDRGDKAVWDQFEDRKLLNREGGTWFKDGVDLKRNFQC